MSRVALLSSEPLRPRMAGIGIRYLEMARWLPCAGAEVVVLAPEGTATADELGLDVEIRPFEAGSLAALLADCDAAVAQGQLANDLVLEVPDLPTVIDLYDPWLIENLHYYGSLGLDPYRNDHRTWVLQLSRGDFFLCSSQEQRLYYLGFLSALGRVNPERLTSDPDLRGLIDVVPFGVPDKVPPHTPFLPPREDGERRVLFGGLYDWYDPWPVLEALEQLDRDDVRLLVVQNPNPSSTPQKLLAEVERWSRQRGWWGSRVQLLDWVPYERRYDLLRDVDALVATHRSSLETDLAMRTRFLDALVAGCPVMTTQGGAVSRLLEAWDAGWVVPEGDASRIARALEEILAGGTVVSARRRAGLEGLVEFRWQRVLEPLVAFCRSPRTDPTKESFAHRPATVSPPDALGFRLRRWLRRRLQGSRP